VNITWDNIYLAIQIVVSVQLFLGIALNILEFKTRNLLLAYSCFLVIYSYNIFFTYQLDNFYLQQPLHIVASYIYFGPTLYLYFKSIRKEKGIHFKDFLKHYSIPVLLCLIYNVVKYPYYNFLIYTILFVYIALSFSICRQLLNHLEGSLRKRLLWFIGITGVYLILDTPMLIIEDLAILEISPFSLIHKPVNTFFYQFIHYPLLYIHFFILSLYAITEIPRFKRYFLTKSLRESGISIKDRQVFSQKIKHFFEVERIFLDPHLSLEVLSEKTHVEKSLVSKLIKEHYQKGFNDVVNQYRVKEFKTLLENEVYKNYDLVGLAKESGFSSKATFYRVFKDLEGVTPNQYKKQLQA